jgi:hypothetical protein
MIKLKEQSKERMMMNNEKIKVLIKEMLNQGLSLGEILKDLDKQHGISMTFMELKFLASEIDYDWSVREAPKEEEKEEDDKKEEEAGKTIIELNKLTRPGAVLHGSVKFASGATADWVLDQFGRLGLENSTGEATPEDMEDFKLELQKTIGA